jgi:hypothetical protein
MATGRTVGGGGAGRRLGQVCRKEEAGTLGLSYSEVPGCSFGQRPPGSKWELYRSGRCHRVMSEQDPNACEHKVGQPGPVALRGSSQQPVSSMKPSS